MQELLMEKLIYMYNFHTDTRLIKFSQHVHNNKNFQRINYENIINNFRKFPRFFTSIYSKNKFRLTKIKTGITLHANVAVVTKHAKVSTTLNV